VVGKSSDDFKLLVGAGLKKGVEDKEWVPSKTLHVCTIDADNNIQCSPDKNIELTVERVAPAYVCLETTDGICSKVLVMGGDLTVNKARPFGDVCTADGCEMANLIQGKVGGTPITNYRLLLLSQAFTLGEHIYTVGGMTSLKDAAITWPDLFEYTARKKDASYELSIKAVSLPTEARKYLQGLYHVITPIDANTVLITGGILPVKTKAGKLNFEVSNKAVLLKLVGDKIDAEVFSMKFSRFGHQAAVLSAGPLKGAILIWGGLTTNKQGDLNYIRHAEIFLP